MLVDNCDITFYPLVGGNVDTYTLSAIVQELGNGNLLLLMQASSGFNVDYRIILGRSNSGWLVKSLQ